LVPISNLRESLRHRLKALKLRGQPNGQEFASAYNLDSMDIPEIIKEVNDAERLEWLEPEEEEDVMVGEKVRPVSSRCTVRILILIGRSR
jgi:hypothetical protein